MRDRLIELLDNATVEKAKYYPNGTPAIMYCEKAVSRQVVYQLADYLLANGVIVPPCRVGQKVYYVIESLEVVAEGHIREIIVAEEVFVQFTLKGWFSQISHIGEIGKTVFLTREEAEQAMKGGAE